MVQDRPVLRPMGLGDLVDTAFALYRQNFVLFAGIAAVLGVPQAIINGVVSGLHSTSFTTTNSTGTEFNGGAIVGAIGLFGASGLIGLVFSTLITGALAQAISARYLGRPITIGEAYRSIGLRTFFVLLGASIVNAFIVGFGFLLLIVPGIFLAVRYSFVSQAVVLERTGVFGALGRSWELVSGSWWRVFGIVIVLAILVGIISAVIGGVVAGIVAATSTGAGPRAVATAVSGIIGVLVQPIQLGTMTLLYYDLRIRKEGFDLEHLARTIDANPPARP